MFFMHRVADRIYNILTYQKKKKNSYCKKDHEDSVLPYLRPFNFFYL